MAEMRAATTLELAPSRAGKDPFTDETRSEGNRKGMKDMTPEERSAWGRHMALARKEKEAAERAEEERLKELCQRKFTVDEFKAEFIDPKAIIAVDRLWDIACRKDDKQLFQWFAEHKIGKPLNRAEVDAQVGVTITVVRPPRRVDLELEPTLVEEVPA